jgi:tRNA-2-methylthio-N6-dimethylallyladenosine synthase
MSTSVPHNHKLYIETVGCQMNMLDSELVVAALRKQGYELTADVAEADTVLFNTCSVREHAEHKIYSALGRLKHSKRRRPDQVIGVIGCMAQKDKTLVFERAPHVDIVVGTGQLAQIPELVDEARANRRQRLAVSLDRRDATRQEVSDSFQSYDPLRDPEMRPSPFQAFVRIMIGCDKFCTYCVVPMTRGPEQSRPPRHIIQEVRQLAGEGVKEVTLLGQTVNSYKATEEGRLYRLSDLIAAFHDTPGLERIKFVTNFPRDMSDDLLHAVRDLPKVARYLHVPAQSGCNDVLKRMKRGYTVEEYRDMMARIRDIVPDCAVSSDFIVGFCGETEESFEKSMDLVRECRFKNSFIFKYSPRPGTKADAMLADNVPEEVKRRRNNEMLRVQNEISEEDNARLIGQDFEVLVEGLSKSARKEIREGEDASVVGRPLQAVSENARDNDGRPERAALQDHHPQLVGRTRCDRIVVFDGNPRLVGNLARVHIDDCTPTTLIGSIVTREYQHGGSSILPILA